ncbi:MAG: hypothetical protein BWK78_02515, partial [Thiotrichaceae bacterium IS1]
MKKIFITALFLWAVFTHIMILHAEDKIPQQCTNLINQDSTSSVSPTPLANLCSSEKKLQCGLWQRLSFKQDKQLDDLIDAGEKAFYQSDYATALQQFEQGLSQAKKQSESCYVGQFFNAIGLVYDSLGKYKEALQCCDLALKIERQGSYSMSLGSIYQKIGHYKQSLKHYEEALTFYRQFKDRQEEGKALANIGSLHLQRGEYQDALTYLNQAYTIQSESGNSIELANTLSSMGLVYRHLGLYQKALEYSQNSLKINAEIANKRGQGAEYTHIGNVYLDVGVLNDVENHAICQKSLESWQKALGNYHKALLISCEIGAKRAVDINLNNIGDVHKNICDYPNAIHYFQDAKQLSEKINDQLGVGITLNNLGEAYIGIQKYDVAKESFQKSIEILKELHADSLWRAQAGLASVEVRLNQSTVAIAHYEQALNTIDELRSHIEENDHKSSFIQDKLFVYDEFIAFLQSEHQKTPNLDYDEKAFETFERKQGRVFLEQIGKSGARRFKGLSEEDFKKEKELEDRVAAARKNLDESYKGVVKEQRIFEEELKKKYKEYYALKHPQPVTLVDLQQNVLQTDEAVLVYNVREKTIDLWFVGKQHFRMFSLPLTEIDIKTQVSEFRKWSIDRANTGGNVRILADSLERDFKVFTEASRTLYQHLFPQSVRELLDQTKPKLLYIIPTLDLYELPFEALITDNAAKPHYLVEDYAISYLSSASLLKTLRGAQPKTQQNERQLLLIFADPVYPKQNCDLLSSEDPIVTNQVKAYYDSLDGGGLDEHRCPKVLSSEVSEIFKSLQTNPEKDLSLMQEDKASRQTVLKMDKLSDFQYIVFSTHGLLPKEITPLVQPALLLSHTNPLEQEQDENGQKILKGFLTMSDVFRLKMNADLVMLSACNTGRGKIVKGEGTIGLTRAFMYAGTPAVSITLWSVESNATKELNVGWFKRLQENQSLADSLRAAKLDMLASKNYYRYPYAWAGI